MAKLKLIDIRKSKNTMSVEEQKDCEIILKKMIEENIELDGWYLDEIPCARTYLFSNLIDGNFFDFEIDWDGELKPHYYKNVEGDLVTKYPTGTIREAIQRYQL